MTSSRFNLLFFGSDSFSIRILNHLLKRQLCPLQVVTGKKSELNLFAIEKDIRCHDWLAIQDTLRQDTSFNIGLVASFGHMIDPNVIQHFRYGTFNVHPSLLPQYRGSSPIQTAILDGLEKTGCSIMKISPVAKFDIGDVMLQQTVSIKTGEYALELRDRLADIGASMAEELLLNYDKCIEMATPQDDQSKSYAKKIRPEQGCLDFISQDSISIDRKIRAYTGFVDLYMVMSDGVRIKLEEFVDPKLTNSLDLDSVAERYTQSDVGSPNSFIPGSIYFHKTRYLLCIKCADGRWVAFRSATPQFKFKMTALEFYNGYLSKMMPNELRTNT